MKNELIRQAQRAQRLYISAYLYKGSETEYLGVVQGLADAFCELHILKSKLESREVA